MNNSPISTMPGARDVLAQLVAPTLHRQRWSLDAGHAATQSRLVHLWAGRAELTHDQGMVALRPPDLVWLPAGCGRNLRIAPGSAGIIVGLSDALLTAAIGNDSDSAALRRLTSRLCQLSAHQTGPRAELVHSLRAIEAETRQGSGGSWPYLTAHVTLVLVLMWRLSGGELPDVPIASQGAARLQQFRQLVEANFRAHWSIDRYAQALSITADSLHALCVRQLKRPPTALVHERLVHQACLLLDGSHLPVERVASDLGFGSASHFSRFFKRWKGVGPKAWRETSRVRAAAGQTVPPASYADWP